MTIQRWLIDATARLVEAGVPSARLDALILLSDELQQNKAQLLAHDDESLLPEQFDNLEMKLQRRIAREPMSYIRGHQEFFGRDFAVMPDVLIPRPETETFFTLLDMLDLPDDCVIADIGTGSGAIAITAKLEHPHWAVIATDVSSSALGVARHNANLLDATIDFREGSLLDPITKPVNAILANLPYVDAAWIRNSPETDAEPALALFAEQHGLALIYQLLAKAWSKLQSGGFVLLEADPVQHQKIIAYATQHNLRHITTEGYIVVLAR